MKVTLELGRRFARQAGFSARVFEVEGTATVGRLLALVAKAAPAMECVEGGTVDLAVASLSVNGRAVDPRDGLSTPLAEGDRCYLYGAVSGG